MDNVQRQGLLHFSCSNLASQNHRGIGGYPLVSGDLFNLIGLPSSIGGNELPRKFGRRRVVTIVMMGSDAFGSTLGFTATFPYLLVVFLVILYGITVTGDSVSLAAGAVAAAPEGCEVRPWRFIQPSVSVRLSSALWPSEWL